MSETITEVVVALLLILNNEIIEHRIQIDPKTNKYSMSMCLKGKRFAQKSEKGKNIVHQCLRNKAEIEFNIDGSKSIKKLILE